MVRYLSLGGLLFLLCHALAYSQSPERLSLKYAIEIALEHNPEIVGARRGDPDPFGRYARRMRARFAPKDLVSWLLQAFLARPALADFALRRMATRDAIRETFGLVLVDELPASRVFDPRLLMGLLRP